MVPGGPYKVTIWLAFGITVRSRWLRVNHQESDYRYCSWKSSAGLWPVLIDAGTAIWRHAESKVTGLWIPPKFQQTALYQPKLRSIQRTNKRRLHVDHFRSWASAASILSGKIEIHWEASLSLIQVIWSSITDPENNLCLDDVYTELVQYYLTTTNVTLRGCQSILSIHRLCAAPGCFHGERRKKKKEEKTSPEMPSLQIYEMKAPGEYAAFLFWEILSSR